MKQDGKSILIHVGYPRSASSWLQGNFFNNKENGYISPWKRSEVIEQLLIANPFEFCPEKTRNFFAKKNAKFFKEDVIPVISEEGFTDISRPLYLSKVFADRLKDVFPKAKILIIIREQKSIILSHYKMLVSEGREYMSIADYLSERKSEGYFPIFDFRVLEYHNIINYYQQLYGESNVLVLPYELLLSDFWDFIYKINFFTGVNKTSLIHGEKANKAMGGFTIYLESKLNALIRRDERKPRSVSGKCYLKFFSAIDKVVPDFLDSYVDKKYKAFIKNIVGDRYVKSNRILLHNLGIDFSEYGYDL